MLRADSWASRRVIGLFKIPAMPTILRTEVGRVASLPLHVIYLPRFYNPGYHAPLWTTSLDAAGAPETTPTALTGASGALAGVHA